MYGESLMCKRDKRFRAKWDLCFREAKRMMEEPSFSSLFVGFSNKSPLFSPEPLDTAAIALSSIQHELFEEQEPMLEKIFFPALVKYLQNSPDYEQGPPKPNPTNGAQNIVVFSRKCVP